MRRTEKREDGTFCLLRHRVFPKLPRGCSSYTSVAAQERDTVYRVEEMFAPVDLTWSTL